METIINAAGAGAPAGGDLIKDTDAAGFAADVIEASRQTPVIVDFWAPWCGPCKQLTPVLEKVVREARGAVKLVKVNIDENQMIAQQLRIQSIPTVYAFVDGRPVDGFQGALPESQVKEFVGRLGGDASSPVAEALEQAEGLMAAGDVRSAGGLYAQILNHEPDNTKAIAGYLRALLALDQVAEAAAMAEDLPDEVKRNKDVAAAIAALELAGNSADSAELAAMRAAVEADPTDHQARIDLALALYGANDREGAVDQLLESIRLNREWNEGAARKQLLKFFEAFGHTDPLTIDARRRLSSILFS